MTDNESGPPSVPSDASIPAMILERAAAAPDRVLFSIPSAAGPSASVTAEEFSRMVLSCAAGLVAAGIHAGDRVAILSHCRFEWTLMDCAIWGAGAVPVPIYETSAPAQISWILEDSSAVAVIAENDELAARIAAVSADLPRFVIERDCVTDIVSRATDESRAEAAVRSSRIRADDLATIIYTSGTTGRPKGCALTHRNFLDVSRSAAIALPDVVGAKGASTVLFITLAHVFARFISVMCLDQGIRVAHEANTARLVQALAEAKPTFLLAVPRVFEKVYNQAAQKAESAGRGRVFRRAAAVAIAYSRCIDAGRIPLQTRIAHAVFDRLVYRTLRAALGGRATHAISGSAPLGDRLGHFYRGIGLTVLEGYGLTETTAPITVNTPTACRIGTVGRPLPGAEVRIAASGEIEVRGSGLFNGYENNPDATAEALTQDGWFRTGDIGALTDGFLTITGRSKELIVTAAGKNVAPAVLEDRIRAHPIVSQVVVVGDARPFIAALVTLDHEMLPAWLQNRGVDPDELDAAAMAAHPLVGERIQAAVDRANAHVSRAESIRKWALLPHDLTEASGHLTPSLKVKRDAVLRDFAAELEAIYAQPGPPGRLPEETDAGLPA